MSLYNLKTSNEDTFIITKFDADLNVQSSYRVTALTCECPQGIKPTCRHRKMLPLIRDRADTAWFFNFEQGQWADPTGQAIVHDIEELHEGPKSGYGRGPTLEASEQALPINAALTYERPAEPKPSDSAPIRRRV